MEKNIRKNWLVVIFADCNLIIVSFIHQHTRNNPGTNLLPTFLTSGIRFYTNGSRSITSFGFMSSTVWCISYWGFILRENNILKLLAIKCGTVRAKSSSKNVWIYTYGRPRKNLPFHLFVGKDTLEAINCWRLKARH